MKEVKVDSGDDNDTEVIVEISKELHAEKRDIDKIKKTKEKKKKEYVKKKEPIDKKYRNKKKYGRKSACTRRQKNKKAVELN